MAYLVGLAVGGAFFYAFRWFEMDVFPSFIFAGLIGLVIMFLLTSNGGEDDWYDNSC